MSDQPWHGTRNGYQYHRCRCDACRQANNDHCAAYYRETHPEWQPRLGRPRVAVADNPDDPRHGTANGYSNHGCRCDRCRAANTANHAAYRARRAAKHRSDHPTPEEKA